MNIKNTILALIASSVISASIYAADVTVDRIINSSTTWTKDNTYFLEGYTFVVTPDGASAPTVLTIEPGTVIKGLEKEGEFDEAAALVITRGAQINANGTSEEPIIFTSELDELNGNLGPEDVNLWGGLVILGDASINSRANGEIVSAPVVDQIEGFSVATEEIDLISFGGTNDDDNSGILRYISIRHGGAVLGTANEINGLTLGGVGRGTTIEYIEIFANKDDGIEWFGGTVNAKYLVAAFGSDDGFDIDQGFRGNIQFGFVIGTDITSDRQDKGGEWDGATSPLDASPMGDAIFANITMVGIGNAGAANTALNIRDNLAVQVWNSVFVDFAKMIDIENDNADRVTAGDVALQSNVFWSHISENNTVAGINARPDGTVAIAPFFDTASFDNQIADPKLLGISRTADGMLDPRPAADSPAASGAATISGDWFTPTNYKGAFDPTVAGTWMDGWTKLSRDGYLKQNGIYYPDSDWFGEVYSFGGPLTPNNFIYLFGLEGFGYIGTAEASGGWVYIFR